VRVAMAATSALIVLALAPAAWASERQGSPDIQIVATPNGPVLADQSGATLYVFIDDLLTKAPSACTGDCANDWPPALVSGKVTLTPGITGHIGTVVRRDGGRQLTMDGRPLYTFAGDRRRGDVRGNGVGNIWWAMTPTGLSATSFPLTKSTYGPPASSTLTVTQSTAGPIVADARGQALYAYTPDTATTSACNANWCLVDWPPLQASRAPTAATGITAPITVITGAGGTQQVVLGGHPLYTFAGDLHPGDIRGQDIGGDWLLVTPNGALVDAHDSGTSSSATAGAGSNNAT
jgi:predicted lipoprotein with Yx(FWY)xxD motif